MLDIEISISSFHKLPIKDLPASVTVITQTELRNSGATNLVEALESVPGINIRRTQFANRPLIHFRGAHVNKTIVMVNGLVMKDLVWRYDLFWKGLPASIIERIEVIRGPGSALYGADAYSGVINVITKGAATTTENQIGMTLGSFNDQGVWLQYGNDWQGYRIDFSADISTTEGHDPFISSDGQTAIDEDRMRRPFWDPASSAPASLAPSYAQYGWKSQDVRTSIQKKYWQMLANYNRRYNVESGFNTVNILDDQTEGESTTTDVSLLYDNPNFDAQWALNGELRYQKSYYDSGRGIYFSPPNFYQRNGAHYPDGRILQIASTEQTTSGKLRLSYTGISQHYIHVEGGFINRDPYRISHLTNFGVDRSGNAIPAGSTLVDLSDSSYAFSPEKERRNHHLLVDDSWQITPDWMLRTGVRYDYFSDFGTSVIPRTALIWNTSPKFTSKLLYGEAFRAPSYQELYTDILTSKPNPDLNAEKSATWELQFTLSPSRSQLFSLNLYQMNLEELISRDSNNQYQNMDKHIIKGAEIEGRWELFDAISLHANLSLRSEENTESKLLFLPDKSAHLSVNWKPSFKWNLHLQNNWQGKLERQEGDSRDPLPSYSITDLTIRYLAGVNWDVTASVNNLFGVSAKSYTEDDIADDIPLPGRNYTINFSYRY